ncbi:MAG: hypothetical protein GX620_15545 [Chloroflexi bacterium]|nr:hypothetical protein [Chloroflexota bacterium]
MIRPCRPIRVIMLLLFLVAFLLRTIPLDCQPLWRDEIDAFRFATAPWSEMLANLTRPGWNGPLYFLLLRFWVLAVGETGFALRFSSVVFGVLCVPLIYVLGCRLLGRPVAWMAALLVATSPYFVWYSQEVKMYTLVPALALLAIYALRRAVQGRGVAWWAVLTIATSLAVYMHILAALLIPVEVLLYFVWWRHARRRWRAAVVSLCSLMLPYLPLLSWQAPAAFQSRDTGFYPYTLVEMVRILIGGWALGIQPQGGPWGVVASILVASIGILCPAFAAAARAVGPTRRASSPCQGVTLEVIALLVWIVVPVSGVALISIRQPMFTDRYLIWAAPALYLLIGLGVGFVASLGRPGGGIAIFMLGALLIFNGVNLWSQATTPIKADFRGATAYLLTYGESHRELPPAHAIVGADRPFRVYLPMIVGPTSGIDGLLVFQIPHGRHSFEYYARGQPYHWADGLYTNHRLADGSYLLTAEQVDWHMGDLVAGHDVVWLIATEAAMWDDRGLVQGWLDAYMHREDEAHFTRVDVYRYVHRSAP